MENYLLKDLNIPSSILASGEEYFSLKRVHLLSEDGMTYKAEVDGKEKYQTSITIKNSRAASFSCSCPYPHLCKHVVALSFAVKDKLNSLVHTYTYKIQRAAFNEYLEEYKGIPYKINSIRDKLTKEEYLSLISTYYSNLSRSDYLYESCSSNMRLEIFNKGISLNDDDYKEVIKQSVQQLRNDPIYLSRFLSMFLKEDETTRATQEFIINNIEDKTLALKQFITGLIGRNLPNILLPEFTLLIANNAPRLLAKKDLLEAKRYFIKEGLSDDLLTILQVLQTKNDPTCFEDEDFQYLIKNGLHIEARKIAFSIMKVSSDFKDYIRYRKLFIDKEFYNVRYQVETVIAYKNYLNSVLIFDGKTFFPTLYESFSYLKLNPYEIYLAKEFITDSSDIHILNEKAHQYIKNEISKKNRNKDYFYYLLYLDYLKDDSISFYLFDKNVLLDKEESSYKGIWLYLVDKNNLLSRSSYMPYWRDKHVFE